MSPYVTLAGNRIGTETRKGNMDVSLCLAGTASLATPDIVIGIRARGLKIYSAKIANLNQHFP
jgi:hypothetical protein